MIVHVNTTLEVPGSGSDWRGLHVLENCRLEWDAPVLAEVGAERERQYELGYDAAHDDEHGAAHIIGEVYRRLGYDFDTRAASGRKVLVECAALLVAAIETNDRAANVEAAGS